MSITCQQGGGGEGGCLQQQPDGLIGEDWSFKEQLLGLGALSGPRGYLPSLREGIFCPGSHRSHVGELTHVCLASKSAPNRMAEVWSTDATKNWVGVHFWGWASRATALEFSVSPSLIPQDCVPLCLHLCLCLSGLLSFSQRVRGEKGRPDPRQFGSVPDQAPRWCQK